MPGSFPRRDTLKPPICDNNLAKGSEVFHTFVHNNTVYSFHMILQNHCMRFFMSMYTASMEPSWPVRLTKWCVDLIGESNGWCLQYTRPTFLDSQQVCTKWLTSSLKIAPQTCSQPFKTYKILVWKDKTWSKMHVLSYRYFNHDQQFAVCQFRRWCTF